MPELQRLPLGQTVLPWRADPEGFSTTSTTSSRSGSAASTTASSTAGSADPVEMRYAWPAELDLMARLAGMRLEGRWAGWRREPFTAVSPAHVSVYEKP